MAKMMDVEALRTLDQIDLPSAKAFAKSQLQMKKTSTKFNNLLRDIDRARTSAEVMRIMWNVMLAGEGLQQKNSDWQKLHKNS